MFIYLVLLLTILPAIELTILIDVGARIGAVNTILIILFTGIFGAHLARLQGFIVMRKIQDNLNQGIMPSSELIDGLMILVGGILLLTPGFVTDTIGLLLLIPMTRDLIRLWLMTKFEKMIKEGKSIHFYSNNIKRDNRDYDDIDLN